MLRKTFAEIVEATIDECQGSSATSRNPDFRTYVQRVVKRHYEVLCDECDWAFLRVDNDEATKALEAGERYYDFPIAMDVKNTLTADVYYNNIWLPLTYGIGPPEYTAFNSDNNVRAEPPLKWRIKDERQFEIWPIPNTDDMFSVRFKGKRLPEPLTSDASRADMDDICISLFASAEILAKQKSADAPVKLKAAQVRLIQLRRLYMDRRTVRIGMGNVQRNPRLDNEILAYRALGGTN